MRETPRLGVELMDRDHAEIDALFATVATELDDDLSGAFARVETAIADHFAREEDLMRSAGVPIYPVHTELHAAVLEEIATMRGALEAGEGARVAAFLRDRLPEAIDNHVATADTASAHFLRGLCGACA